MRSELLDSRGTWVIEAVAINDSGPCAASDIIS